MSSLALVMIARDEARCIERCLRSAEALVDEMLVLDTGSVDDTAALARGCGATVAHWSWRDDFAAARNAALDLTSCDWRLVIDADEWIAGGGASLAACRAAAPGFIGVLRVSSLIDGGPSGTQQAPSWLPRLLPRGVTYQGRVHEQPLSAWPRRRMALRLQHDGYLPDAMARKRGRNRRLLQQALLDDPDDAYLHYQLGKDFEVHGDFVAAAPCFSRALARADRSAGWRHDLLLRQLFTLKKLGRFEAGMALAQREMEHWAHSPDFFFTLGDLLLDWAAARPAMAASLLPMIESSWLRALHIGENPTLQDTVSGRGSFLAAHNLAVMFEALGDAAKACLWRERSAAMRRIADLGSKALLPA